MAMTAAKPKAKNGHKIALTKATGSEIIRGLHVTEADKRYVEKLMRRVNGDRGFSEHAKKRSKSSK